MSTLNPVQMGTQAAKDLALAAAGLLVLKGIGLKFEVGQINMKTLAFGAAVTGLGGAFGREAANWYNNKRKDNEMTRLAALTVCAAGALALTQTQKVSNFVRLPAFTQLTNFSQKVAVGLLSTAAMVGFRFFGSLPPTSSTF